MPRFVGGPCDGRDVGFNLNATISCGGVNYTRGPGGDYYQSSVAGGGGPSSLDTKQIGKAWQRLMHVYAVEAPAAIRRSTAARSRLRRLSR